MKSFLDTYVNTFANLFVVAVHTLYQYMLCIVTIATVSMYTMLSTTKYQNTPHLVAIVGCNHVEFTTASLRNW